MVAELRLNDDGIGRHTYVGCEANYLRQRRLEKYLTLANERYVQPLLGADEWRTSRREQMRRLGLSESRASRCTPCLRLWPRDEAWDCWQIAAGAKRVRSVEGGADRQRDKDTGLKIRKTRTKEHQVDMYENLAGPKLDEDVKIIVVMRETPMKLRDNVQDKPQQFETNFKLRAVSQAFLNTNRKWKAK